MRGRRIAVLGFVGDGSLGRVVQALINAGAEVITNDAPDTVDAVLVGLDGDGLLDRVRFVRDTGYRGPLVGIGRLDKGQRRRWARMHDTRSMGIDGDGLYQVQSRQVLVNADPAEIDADTVLVALEVGDGAEVVEVVRRADVQAVKTTMEILADEDNLMPPKHDGTAEKGRSSAHVTSNITVHAATLWG